MGCSNNRDALLGLLDSAVEIPLPVAALSNKVEKARFQPRIVDYRPMHIRLMLWSMRIINMGGPLFSFTRTKRVLLWLLRTIPRMFLFIKVVSGGKVNPQIFESRQETCSNCVRLVRVLRLKKPHIKEYCGQCGCPNWKMSELKTKNQFRKHECPMNLQEPKRIYPKAWVDARDVEVVWIKKMEEQYGKRSS